MGSGSKIATGENNVFIGHLSGSNSPDANDNVFIGDYAGGNYIGTAISGSDNVFIGRKSGSLATGSGNVFLGNETGVTETGSNKLFIDNSDTSTPLIYGEFDNNLLRVNGDLDVTGSTSVNALTAGNTAVEGTLSISGTATFNGASASIIHPTGTANGLYFQNTYSGNVDTWHFYQYTSDELALFFNSTKKGDFDYVSGAYTAVSDKRFKKNIESFSSVLDKVMLLQPKKYHFISQSDKDKKYVGLIAQDVKELFPSFVHYTNEDDAYTMDYAGFSVVAIQAIKEQQGKINEQQEDIDNLRLEIEEIKKLLNK